MEGKVSQFNPDIHFPNKLPLVSNYEAKGNKNIIYLFLIFIKFLLAKIKIKKLT